MRKIESQMLAAINAGKDWTSGNTRVVHPGVEKKYCRVYLHGNLIATNVGGQWSFTLAGWNTPTTRSRLNALGAKVWTQRGQAHYNECHADGTLKRYRPISDTDWFPIV